MITGILIASVALLGTAFSLWFIARGAGRLTAAWAVMLVLAVGIAVLVWNISGIYYRMPLGWAVALASAVLVVVALGVMVAKSVAWKRSKVAATLGLVVFSFAIMVVAMIFLPLGAYFVPIFEARGQQIAEEAGFTALYADGYDLKLDYLPVDAIGGKPAKALLIRYEGFEVQERASEGALAIADLKGLLASGEDPFDYGAPISSDATYEEYDIGGRPALGVEYAVDPTGAPGKSGGDPGKQGMIRMLVFERDGVLVLLRSEGAMEYQGGSGDNEQYDYVEAMEFDELVAVAKSLAPIE